MNDLKELLVGSDSNPDEGLEAYNDLVNSLCEIGERWKNRIEFETCSISEQYIKGRLSIAVDIYHASSGNSYCIQYSALPNNKAGAPENVRRPVPESDIKIDMIKLDGTDDRRDHDMLVNLIQGVECFQQIIPSFVCAYRVGEHRNNSILALEYSIMECRYKFIPVIKHPESSPFCRIFPSELNKLDVSHVESGSQVVNSVTEREGDLRRDVLSHFELENIIVAISVSIYAKYIKVCAAEGCHLPIEIKDVLVGPFDL